MQRSREIIKHEENRVARLEKEINYQLPSIAPIRKIPSEILGYIIELHASIEWWAPALDGSVSRQFRQAVLAYPRAWSYPTLERGKSRRRITKDVAELWMERAGASPLHVRIDAFEDTLYRPILMRCPEQVVDLNYSGSIKDLRKTCLPNLRRLSLHLNSDASTNPFIDDVDGKHPIPSLDSLALMCLVRVPFALTPSFPPITMLYLHDVDPGDCWGLVSHCSKTLKHLTVDDCKTFIMSERIDFPALEFLSLCRIEYSIDVIFAPNLHVTHEGFAPGTPCIGFPLVVEYVSVGNEPGARGEWSDLEVLSYLFPNLQRLGLRESPQNVAWVLESLAEHPDIWPHLQLLEAPVTSNAEAEWFSDLLDKRNFKAKVPLAASWIRRKFP
jgi:hypothetical protein